MQAFEINSKPLTHAEMDFLTAQINEDAKAAGVLVEAYPFSFAVRDEEGSVLAGVNGSMVYGVIYTDQLWVHPVYRNKGWGRLMMERVHEVGHAAGCTLATVATLSFQGVRSFYEHLGYCCDFERPGYANGSALLFLKKTLIDHS